MEIQREKITKYISLSKIYIRNADLMIKKREYNKAGEMLWGAIAELLKGIGIIHDYPIRTHKELIKIAKYIALNKNDKELDEAIVNHGQALHANFYEDFLDIEVFKKYRESVLEAYNKLFKIILEFKQI